MDIFLISSINTIACLIIFVLGFTCYNKNSNVLALGITIAFGLFTVSHVIRLTDLTPILEIALIVVRLLAYLAVLLTLIKSLTVKETQ